MKKVISIILLTSLFGTLILSVSASKPVSNSGSKTTISDAIDIFKHLAEIHQLSDERVKQLNFDGSGKVNIGNAITIFKGLAGIIQRPRLITLQPPEVFPPPIIGLTIISGGEEYVPRQKWIHGWSRTIQVSGTPYRPQQFDTLPLITVPYHDDFSIRFNSPPDRRGRTSYILYDSELNRFNFQNIRPTLPLKPGTYTLQIIASWTDAGGTGSQYQYLIKIMVC